MRTGGAAVSTALHRAIKLVWRLWCIGYNDEWNDTQGMVGGPRIVRTMGWIMASNYISELCWKHRVFGTLVVNISCLGR